MIFTLKKDVSESSTVCQSLSQPSWFLVELLFHLYIPNLVSTGVSNNQSGSILIYCKSSLQSCFERKSFSVSYVVNWRNGTEPYKNCHTSVFYLMNIPKLANVCLPISANIQWNFGSLCLLLRVLLKSCIVFLTR
jgi:hypothetical protein